MIVTAKLIVSGALLFWAYFVYGNWRKNLRQQEVNFCNSLAERISRKIFAGFSWDWTMKDDLEKIYFYYSKFIINKNIKEEKMVEEIIISLTIKNGTPLKLFTHSNEKIILSELFNLLLRK